VNCQVAFLHAVKGIFQNCAALGFVALRQQRKRQRRNGMVWMTHRQRALAALRGEIPDFVPTFELVFHETERDFGGRLFYGAPGSPDARDLPEGEIFAHNARLYIDIARRFEHSIIHVAPVHWPFVSHHEEVAGIIRLIREISGEEFCVMSNGDPTFKIPGNPLDFSMRMYDDPEGLKREAQQRVDAMLPAYDAVLAAGADGVVMSSDYAFNNATFLSPAQFGDFITPYLAKAVREIHARGGMVIKHSDGNLMGVMDQLVQAGPDALHSIDPMAGMDIREIKKHYGRRICLCGNVHCAWMQTGTDEQIRGSALYCLQHAKPGGGYIFSTSNCVFRGMPLRSYDRIHELWKQNREYEKTPCETERTRNT
jgi:uroporphyrinogen decarboxylase